jgi:hypothetical protein
MSDPKALVAVVLAVVVTTAAGCGHHDSPSAKPTAAPTQERSSQATDASSPGDIPDTQAFVTFAAPDRLFAVDVPEGWARTDSHGGVTFTDNFNSVVVEIRGNTTAPTPGSARLTELPAIAAATPSVSSGAASTVTRTAGEAILLTYQQDSGPNPVTGKGIALAVERYEFFRNGHTVALTLAGPVGADNVDPWRRITDSFRWMP